MSFDFLVGLMADGPEFDERLDEAEGVLDDLLVVVFAIQLSGER